LSHGVTPLLLKVSKLKRYQKLIVPEDMRNAMQEQPQLNEKKDVFGQK
jgi:uncharacterized protein YdeI (YjbR/CyaY-like superfamily)